MSKTLAFGQKMCYDKIEKISIMNKINDKIHNIAMVFSNVMVIVALLLWNYLRVQYMEDMTQAYVACALSLTFLVSFAIIGNAVHFGMLRRSVYIPFVPQAIQLFGLACLDKWLKGFIYSTDSAFLANIHITYCVLLIAVGVGAIAFLFKNMVRDFAS